ncbi:M61 family metallopeptidase [Acanthopleuribacter pedis]|uniref:M61 family metallopeptidase n=1 Tax=Acanthopleuribacter pedis TaxID=442870 RepID=A0A8J7Q4G4_9BACT|nr:PDZ domain-containing protein [Acanthopleuribacter pedis]MBO1318975.1 M61 family metallopeptidase [Acanthopleuribacter pedis]
MLFRTFFCWLMIGFATLSLMSAAPLSLPVAPFAAGVAAQNQAAPVIQAKIAMPLATQHYFDLEITFPPQNEAGTRRLQMPVWTPGSYKVRDYAKNVEAFAARDPKGEPLPWRKGDKSTWLVDVPAKTPLTVSYQLFAYTFSVRTSYIDSFYGFINPASAFLYEPGREKVSYQIAVTTPENWTVATAMPRIAEQVFLADNLDVLVDTPMVFGPLRRHEFEVAGIPHYWVIAGDVNMNEAGMTEALKKIGEVVGDLFGGYPFDRYYYLSQFRLDGARGGLEHANSTMVQASSDYFRTDKGWDYFLGLLIHEYYHAWNVKAFRDKALETFDYQNEQYTDMLWLHEGWTSYYDNLLMGRAGFWDEKQLLKAFSKELNRYYQTPGNTRQSLTEASFDAWIHLYQRDESFKNARSHYYATGALAAFALDLVIRHRSKNEASLDTVNRRLYQDYGAKGLPIDWDIVHALVSEVGTKAAGTFLDRHVRRAEAIPFDKILGYAGMTFTVPEETDKAAEKAYKPPPEVSLGIDTETRTEGLFIRHVYRERNGWSAGLDFGDELLALNGRRVTPDNFQKLLQWSHPGDVVEVLVSRSNKILTIPVKLVAKEKAKVLVFDEENATASQKSIYRALFPEDPELDKTKQQEKSWQP